MKNCSDFWILNFGSENNPYFHFPQNLLKIWWWQQWQHDNCWRQQLLIVSAWVLQSARLGRCAQKTQVAILARDFQGDNHCEIEHDMRLVPSNTIKSIFMHRGPNYARCSARSVCIISSSNSHEYSSRSGKSKIAQYFGKGSCYLWCAHLKIEEARGASDPWWAGDTSNTTTKCLLTT